MKIQTLLNEVPIQDIDHVGDFSKGSSFTHKRDRMIVTHPASIQNIKKKFGNVKQNINLMFVNTKEGRHHTEVGKVDPEWVKKNLGEQVSNSLEKINTDNAITVIFTNNKGDQRVPMTPWIMAHRLMHSLARSQFSISVGSSAHYKFYNEAADEIIRFTSEYIMPAYFGYEKEFPSTYRQAMSAPRDKQLFLKYLFQEIGTFKSARDKKLRDWFEFVNELGAQYIITGDVKFNPLPKTLGPKGFGRQVSLTSEDLMVDQAEDGKDSMASYFKLKMDKLLDSAVGTITVM